MIKTLLTAALASVALTSFAQIPDFTYRGDVTIHEEPSLSELIWLSQQEAREKAIEFQRMWLYELNNIQKDFWIHAVPGLGAAVRNNDWAAALPMWNAWTDQELAYEKYYHRRSPAWIAAYNATFTGSGRPTKRRNTK